MFTHGCPGETSGVCIREIVLLASNGRDVPQCHLSGYVEMTGSHRDSHSRALLLDRNESFSSGDKNRSSENETLRDSYYFCHQLPQTYWLNKRHTFTVFLEVKISVSTGVNIPVGGHRENVLCGLSQLAEAAFLPGSQPVLRLHGQQQRAHCVSH